MVYPVLASLIAVAIIPFINHFYLWLRKFHRDRDADIELEEIQKEKEVIKEKQELQKSEQELQKSEQENWNDDYDEILKTGIIPTIVRFIFEED